MQSGKISLLSAIFASTCCVVPLMLLGVSLLGLGAVGLSGVSTFVGSIKWIIMPIAIIGLAFSYYKFFKEKRACEQYACQMVGKKTNLILLAISTVIVSAFLIFSIYPYLSASQKIISNPSDNFEQVSLNIKGMTCATCAITAQKALESVPGVQKAWVSLKDNMGIVNFDPSKVKEEQLLHALGKVGYKAEVLREHS